MMEELEQILDTCLDRINRGESLERCLQDYPRQATALEPLLRTALQTREGFRFTPSADARRSARLRFYAALDKKRRPSVWSRLGSWQPAWSVVSSVLLVLVIALAALQSPLVPFSLPPGEPLPSGITVMSVNAPSKEGNFAFLVSDEENAIGDFTSLYITIDKVTLLKGGDGEALVEFTPEVSEFDLTLLPGEKTQQLWQGDIPQGNYSKVFISISGVRGVLKATGEEINVKLPGGKLHLTSPFQVTADSITSFTFDITVVKTGQANAGKYLLQPQASESGATRSPQPARDKGKGKP